MSWFEQLARLYEKLGEGLPPFHALRKTCAVAEITRDGTLISIKPADFSAAIPVTERSDGRTSAVLPHPLFDTPDYLSPADRNKNDEYIAQLEQWALSVYGDERLVSVLRCVKRGLFPKDFPKRGVVVFSVEGEPLWDNEEIQSRWAAYCRSTAKRVGVCGGTGIIQPLYSHHPKGILPKHPSAKLISANADGRLLFSERFSTVEEALSVGAQSSYAAHRALSLLISEVGVYVADTVFAGFTDSGELIRLNELFFSSRRDIYSHISGETAVLLAVSAHSKGRANFSMYREVSCGELREALYLSREPLLAKVLSGAVKTCEAPRYCTRQLDRLLIRGQEQLYRRSG